jgi:hypothetical protein
MGASTSKRLAGEGFLEQQVKGVSFCLRTRGLLCRHKYTISKNCTVIGAISYDPAPANPPHPPPPPPQAQIVQSTCATRTTAAAASWPFAPSSHHTCACPLPPCTCLWRQGLQLLLPARDVGVLPSLEHFSLISEYSFSDDGHNSVLPTHSFTESVLLMRLRHISPILTMGRSQSKPVLEFKCC